MSTNDFLPFAGGVGSNVLTQAAYAALSARTAGFSAGVAKSAELNKVWRQSSIIAAVIGQLINDMSGQDALDDGTTTILLENLKSSIGAVARLGSTSYATDTGTTNTYAATYTPAITSLTDGIVLRFKAANANTGASTFNPSGLGAKPIIGLGGAVLIGGEIVTGSQVSLMYSSSAEAWTLVSASNGSAMSGRLLNIQVFNASGTYTPTAGMKSVIVEGVGAGGGSGGTTATGSNQASLGGGGASGAYARGRFTAAQVGASQAITVGAGGTAGPVTTGNAGTGGTTSFGSLMSAPGGGGGAAGGIGSPPTFMGAGGLPSSAPVGANIVGFAGNTGGAGMLLGVTTGLSGLGSSSPFGAGGAPQGSAVGAIGLPGTGYGSGAGGSSNAQSQAARVGAAGQPGILIVWEYA